MIENEFLAAITREAFLEGEARHQEAEQSRQLAMSAGLSKSSSELQEIWDQDPELYLVTLKGAIAAYEENKNVQELLISCIARLASVVEEQGDANSALIDKAVEIVRENEIAD